MIIIYLQIAIEEKLRDEFCFEKHNKLSKRLLNNNSWRRFLVLAEWVLTKFVLRRIL